MFRLIDRVLLCGSLETDRKIKKRTCCCHFSEWDKIDAYQNFQATKLACNNYGDKSMFGFSTCQHNHDSRTFLLFFRALNAIRILQASATDKIMRLCVRHDIFHARVKSILDISRMQ